MKATKRNDTKEIKIQNNLPARQIVNIVVKRLSEPRINSILDKLEYNTLFVLQNEIEKALTRNKQREIDSKLLAIESIQKEIEDLKKQK